MPPQASEELYRTVQRLELVAVLAGRRAWSRMGDDFDTSWAGVAPSLVEVTSAAQLAAATAAVAYVPAVLEETGQPDAPEARVRPRAFAGVASDGRSLPGLLAGAVRYAKVGVARGMDGGDALALGQRWLDGALQTIVADAARDATAAEVIVRPGMGWVRIANPPCCSRCAVLAGTFYRWNEPNPRHKRCDCITQPVTRADSTQYLTKPDDLVRRGLVTDLTKAQKARIDDGQNLVKVLNESRDRWRERMAAERKATRDEGKQRTTYSDKAVPQPARSVNDFMAHLTSRVDALKAMQSAGIVD